MDTRREADSKYLLRRGITGIILILILLFACGCGTKTDQDQQTQQTTEASRETSPSQTQAEKPDEPLSTIFFASDYQEEDGWPRPEETLTGILETVSSEEEEPDEAVFLGDYTNDRSLHDYQLSPEDSIEEIRGAVKDVFPGMDEDQLLFIQGNHDQLTGSIASSGLHEFDDFLIYVLNTENDFPWKQGKVPGCLKKVKRSSAEMKECFDQLIAAGESRPVFIAGHVPLHYTARTSSRHTTGDNLYSSLIFDVVNEAGRSLDIVYLFGHDHSKGWDCYLGGSSVYKGVGDSLIVPDFGEDDVNSDRYTEKELAFTYLNGGYIGYYMNCGPEELDAGAADQYQAADDRLTGTVCRVWPDRLELIRYDTEGVHPLGWEGEGNPYKGGIDQGLIPDSCYSDRVESPQVVDRHQLK